VKLHIGTAHVQTVLDQLAGWFPGRGEELAKVGEKAKLGLELDVKPMRQRHTQSQRGAYWACLHEFGRALGYTAAETESLLHPVICSEAFGVRDHKTVVCRGESYTWPVPSETSSKTADGRVRDVETYNILIDTLLRFAGEYGVYVEGRRA